MISDGGMDGWRRPTSATGYEPPLQVRIRRESGGRVKGAMAREDYEYWTVDNVDPEVGLSLSAGGLVAAGSLLAFNSIRVSRHRRR